LNHEALLPLHLATAPHIKRVLPLRPVACMQGKTRTGICAAHRRRQHGRNCALLAARLMHAGLLNNTPSQCSPKHSPERQCGMPCYCCPAAAAKAVHLCIVSYRTAPSPTWLAVCCCCLQLRAAAHFAHHHYQPDQQESAGCCALLVLLLPLQIRAYGVCPCRACYEAAFGCPLAGAWLRMLLLLLVVLLPLPARLLEVPPDSV
jgi:hypothetical protein